MGRMRTLTLLGLVVVGACVSGPAGPSTQETGRDGVAVAYGETRTVPGTILQIGFQELLGDSRCPSDVLCVWEGEGRIELGLTLGDGPTMPVQLNTRGPRAVTFGGYTIELVELAPYPVSTQPREPADYVAFLRVTRGGTGQ